MPRKIKVGLVGCGNIANQYVLGCRRYDVLEVVACASLNGASARAKAAEHGIQRACTVDELLAMPDVDIVVNLTIPAAHAAINEAALRAGKHVYAEKPFALSSRDGARALARAKEKGLLVGCAPDTFLGGGIQTARKLLDDGAIGRPVAAFAFMLCHGHEHWHPSPEFYYAPGGGPMFDMGPYYFTALISLLGPVAAVTGLARTSIKERTISSKPLAGKKINVTVPTHYASTAEFANGTVASLVLSFDVWPGPVLPRIVVYGTEGTMEIPDPNRFDGDVRLFRPGAKEPEVVPHTHLTDRGRGTGIADMAYSILRPGRPHRATGELAQHLVEVMEAFDRASAEGRHVRIASTCTRPSALPTGLPANALDV